MSLTTWIAAAWKNFLYCPVTPPNYSDCLETQGATIRILREKCANLQALADELEREIRRLTVKPLRLRPLAPGTDVTLNYLMSHSGQMDNGAKVLIMIQADSKDGIRAAFESIAW